MIVIFRSRLRPGDQSAYHELAPRMEKLARTMPGFVSFDGYTDASGKRVSIIEFESEETLRAWREHPRHLEAQRLGREAFYSEYSLEVCEKRRDSHFRFEGDPSPR